MTAEPSPSGSARDGTHPDGKPIADPGADAPTISDVARAAGVGKTSVSRYLNGDTAALSPALKARIETAIAALAYRPNQMARSLKRGRTRLVGILVADLRNPYSVAVMQGIEAACHQAGLMPMLCNAANEIDLQGRYLDLLRTYRAEGLIVNPVGLPEAALIAIGAGGMPLVLLDRTVDGVDCDSVGLDNTRAARQIVDHLVDGGFGMLFFVSESFAAVSSRREREAAFAERARQRGVTARTLVVTLAEAASIDAALDAVASACAAHPHDPAIPLRTARGGTSTARRVALLAANGQTMLRIAVALAARPLPTLGLATFDDPDWLPLAAPGITSLRQPTYDIGVRAVQLLAARIDGDGTPARHDTFDAELIPRKSTRALPGHLPDNPDGSAAVDPPTDR